MDGMGYILANKFRIQWTKTAEKKRSASSNKCGCSSMFSMFKTVDSEIAVDFTLTLKSCSCADGWYVAILTAASASQRLTTNMYPTPLSKNVMLKNTRWWAPPKHQLLSRGTELYSYRVLLFAPVTSVFFHQLPMGLLTSLMTSSGPILCWAYSVSILIW